MQGAGGVIVPPEDYFPRIRDICDAYDVLLIADDVITGFGRTGTWFGLEHWGIEPDIMQFAKGITSGYVPLCGIGVSDKVKQVMADVPPSQRWMHAYTYSGHPTSSAVALANIDIIENEGLVQRAAEMGKPPARRALPHARRPGRRRRGARRLGLMTAVELVADKAAEGAAPGRRQGGPGACIRR